MSNSKQPYPPVRTAAGLQECGRLRKGETVLITAAAGGAGQFAVQLAKLAGCHVIATVGSEDKARLIRSLGADRAVNYRTEDLKAVLRTEYPRGVDVVWESVGGEWFGTCLNALAQKGRLIVIGAMSQYKGPDGWKPMPHLGLPEKVLNKSTTVTGGHVGWGREGWGRILMQRARYRGECHAGPPHTGRAALRREGPGPGDIPPGGVWVHRKPPGHAWVSGWMAAYVHHPLCTLMADPP